ncbi:MAG TPA: hypothetical protein VFA11_10735 [Acidimicrobiales bacterium]|nr:hypothetical protein [Acidimicrobiales bacterium]
MTAYRRQRAVDPFARLPRHDRRALRRALAHAFRDELALQRDRALGALRAAIDAGGELVGVRWLADPVPTAELAFECGLRARLHTVHRPSVVRISSALPVGPVQLRQAEHPGPFFALYFDAAGAQLPVLSAAVRVVEGRSPAGLTAPPAT